METEKKFGSVDEKEFFLCCFRSGPVEEETKPFNIPSIIEQVVSCSNLLKR